MPRGDWRSIAALGLAVALYLTWIVMAVVQTMPPLEYDPSQYATEAERRKGREDQDTYAQIWMGWVGVAQVIIGTVGLLGLGATIIFARNAWLEAQQANVAANEALQIEQTPLITARPSGETLWFHHETNDFRVETSKGGRRDAEAVYFVLKNGGRGAAIVTRLCRDWKVTPRDVNPPAIVYPNGPIKSVSIPLGSGDEWTLKLRDRRERKIPKAEKGDWIWFYGWVEYADVTKTNYYLLGYSFLCDTGSEQGLQMALPKEDGEQYNYSRRISPPREQPSHEQPPQ